MLLNTWDGHINGSITGIWEAMEMLNTLVDDSDPDVRILPMLSRRHNS